MKRKMGALYLCLRASQGLYNIRGVKGIYIYRDNGKERVNYYIIGFHRDFGKAHGNCYISRGYIRIIEKRMETTI